MRFSILPYNKNSASANLLNEALREKGHRSVKISPSSPRYTKITRNDATLTEHNFINWGCGTSNIVQPNSDQKTVNRFMGWGGNSSILTNKRDFFTWFQNHGGDVNSYLPTVYTSLESVSGYLARRLRAGSDDYPVIVERQKLNGTNGDGTLFLKAGEAPTQYGKLWVEYKKKTSEFRIHCFKGRVIAAQIKKIPTASIPPDDEGKIATFVLRNFSNGWRYSLMDYADVPTAVSNAITLFMGATELHNVADFYAVDIIYNSTRESAWILEANRAPGLSAVTAPIYADAFIAAGV